MWIDFETYPKGYEIGGEMFVLVFALYTLEQLASSNKSPDLLQLNLFTFPLLPHLLPSQTSHNRTRKKRKYFSLGPQFSGND